MTRGEKHNVRRITEFSVIGALVSVFSFVQLWLYIDVLRIEFLPAYILQTVVSVNLNFFGNYLVTWRDRELSNMFWRVYSTFWLTRSVMIFVNPVLFAVMTEFNINYLLSQLVVLLLNTVLNYILGDKLIFAKTRSKEIP